MRLTCTSNSEAGSTSMPTRRWIVSASRRLFSALIAAKRARNPGSSAAQRSRSSSSRSFSHAWPRRSVSSAERPGVRLLEPAAHRDAVRDVGEAVRVKLGEVAEDRLLHQLRMELGDAVHRVAREHREVRHADHAAVALVDQRHALAAVLVVRVTRGDLVEQRAVQQVDDLQVARQDALEERHRPHLERLGQQRVVRVARTPAA